MDSDSKKELPFEKHGKVIIYPFCWLYRLDLRSISHIDSRSSTLNGTEHLQWHNQVVRILHCFALNVNGFVTEKTCLRQMLYPQSWERSWLLEKNTLACLECTKLYQVNESRHEGRQKPCVEGVMTAKGNAWRLIKVPAKDSTRAEPFPCAPWQSAHLPCRYQEFHLSPSTASSPKSLVDLLSATTSNHKHLMCHGPRKML